MIFMKAELALLCCGWVLFGEKATEMEYFKHAEDPGKAFILKKKKDWRISTFKIWGTQILCMYAFVVFVTKTSPDT